MDDGARDVVRGAAGRRLQGGACGYGKLTGAPYGPKIAAGNEPIYQGGLGCGQCYDVKCSYAECNAQPTRIVITDLCPGGLTAAPPARPST